MSELYIGNIFETMQKGHFAHNYNYIIFLYNTFRQYCIIGGVCKILVLQEVLTELYTTT